MPARKRRSGGGHSAAKRSRRTTTKYRTKGKRAKKRTAWKVKGRIPRTIVPSDYQSRSVCVNFDYFQSWAVSPQLQAAQPGGVANNLQLMTFTMNSPCDIFSAHLPFALGTGKTTTDIPGYAAAQIPYTLDGSNVLPSSVSNFTDWAKRYEKACVIGSKVTFTFRPKSSPYQYHNAAYSMSDQNNTPPTTSTITVPSFENTAQTQEDSTNIITHLTDAVPMGTDPESVTLTDKIAEIMRRAGIKRYRMGSIQNTKSGVFCTVNYSAKKFNDVKDIKDNDKLWQDIDRSTWKLNNPTKPVFGVVALQKEEIASPTYAGANEAKAQGDYFVEVKASYTVLFRDPYQVADTNIPMAGVNTGTGQTPRQQGSL
jgi:hypothetical protein